MSARRTSRSRLLGPLVAFAVLLFASAPEAAPIQIVAFGDSNTAGFGVPGGSNYPSKLQRALRAKGYDVTVRNRGANGDTTARALARLSSAVPPGTRIAIVFFGRNDVRLGVSAATIRRNLNAIVGRLRARGVQVILCGFYPFDFSSIAAAHGALYAGDFFAGVAVRGVAKTKYALPHTFVPHLNAAGYSVVAGRLEPLVERLIGRPGR